MISQAARCGVLIALCLVLTACVTPGVPPDDPEPPAGPRVLAAFYPLQYAASRIAGPDITVENLTQPGAEPHDVELTPRQIAQIAEADLVVYLAGVQPAVDRAIAEAPPKRAVEVGGLLGRDITRDPHVWLDPENMTKIGIGIADAMTTMDAADTEGFGERAAELGLDMTSLDRRYTERLDSCATRAFVVSHAAFGTLAARYDLEQIAIRGLSPDEEPSPARLAEVQRLAAENDVDTIFYETLVSPEISESLAADLQLKTAVLDPIEGLGEQSAGQDYIAIMDANLAALVAANRCR